ncbi:hypothetical protein NQ314_020864 [Rhamnusium bicolor]|uniref:Uncharacterized protein n=1 Tax=Rhamnusium bicolor TaxID=1586634 RepID=A0AAV8WJL0_9CUCU|nr:hypothetical protein NQ314_020864 [Rhamnusium bicolor]
MAHPSVNTDFLKTILQIGSDNKITMSSSQVNLSNPSTNQKNMEKDQSENVSFDMLAVSSYLTRSGLYFFCSK